MKSNKLKFVFLIMCAVAMIVACDSDDPCFDTIEPQKEVNFRVSYEMPVNFPEIAYNVEFKSKKIYCEGDVKGEFKYDGVCGVLDGWKLEWPATLTYKFNNSLDVVEFKCFVYDALLQEVILDETKVVTFGMVNPGVTELVEFVSY